MRITNTYLDVDKDVWWAIDVHIFIFISTDQLFQASKSARDKFDSWIVTDFTKTEIGTKHD